MASLVLSGTIFDRGGHPFQNLEMLFKVRNQYMHLPVLKQREQAEGEPQALMPKWFQTLQGRGLARRSPGEGQTWMVLMQTPEMAEWACRAASDAMIAILNMLPMGVRSQLKWKGKLAAYLDSTGIDP